MEGIQFSDINRLIRPDAENGKLKYTYVDLSLTTQLQQEIIKKLLM